MTTEETKMWLDSLKKDIGQPQHQALWYYAEALDMAIQALQDIEDGKYIELDEELENMLMV